MYPHERSLVKKFADAPFALIGVNSDRDKEKLAKRIQEENITWRSFWCGPQGTRGPIPTRWNVSGWPTIYLIDHEGVIRSKGHSLNDELLEQLIEEARKQSGQ